MTRGQQIIEKIKSVFAEIREKYPLITDEDLHKDGAIFYMNGNEFYMYHKNEIGFIKLYVNKGDTYTAYVFPNGEMSATETIRGRLNNGDSLYLATILYRKADRKYIYDEVIDEIDFTYEPKWWEMQEMKNEYDEDEEW